MTTVWGERLSARHAGRGEKRSLGGGARRETREARRWAMPGWCAMRMGGVAGKPEACRVWARPTGGAGHRDTQILERVYHRNVVSDLSRMGIERVDLTIEEEHLFPVVLGLVGPSDEPLIFYWER